MENKEKEIGSLILHIEPAALRSIIGSGRLLELADTVARQAAAQISAQLVEHVAAAAFKADGLKSGVSANVSYVFDEGDGGFGTKPPPPKFGVARLDQSVQTALRQLAAPEVQG